MTLALEAGTQEWERFWSKVDTAGDCWEWTASRTSNGYGQFRNPRLNRPVRAHRVAWETLVGPVPDDLVCDHLCRNRLCINPDHIELVTRGENTRRGMVAYKNACRRGHDLTLPRAFYYWGKKRQCAECAKAWHRTARR